MGTCLQRTGFSNSIHFVKMAIGDKATEKDKRRKYTRTYVWHKSAAVYIKT